PSETMVWAVSLRECLLFIAILWGVSVTVITEILRERLRLEGNTHLLRKEELPPMLEELKVRPDITALERSRMRRFIYRMHQRSRMRRVIYQLRYVLEMLRNKINSLLLPTRGSGAQRKI